MTDIEKINRYTQKQLTEDEVFVFSLVLCDNEIDRDYERFTVDGLKKLQKLFEGKTGISDHSAKSADQNARIFETALIVSEGLMTSYGEPYVKLTAKAYMVRTEENSALIKEIEGGIKKEVSIGCSVKKNICSVCGENIHSTACNHQKGRMYGNKLCYSILDDPDDAYEWSFVAVPAQRNAGVSKGYKHINEKYRNKFHDNSDGAIIVSRDDYTALMTEFNEMSDYCAFGKMYREKLLDSIRKNLAVYDSNIDEKSICRFANSLSPSELVNFEQSIKKSCGKNAVPIQLAPKENKSGDMEFYC